MEAKDDDFSSVAWPGFVDILSTVIMMFLFFIMIVSIAMYAMSAEFKKTVAKENEKVVTSRVSEEVKKYIEKMPAGDMATDEVKSLFEYKEQVKQLTEENQKLKEEIQQEKAEISKNASDLAQANSGMDAGTSQETIKGNKEFVILFNDSAVGLSDITTKAIEAFITSASDTKPGKIKFSILAGDNPNAPTNSLSRELSLARALNIRNVFLKQKIPANFVSVKYKEAEKVKDSYNWVKIKVDTHE